MLIVLQIMGQHLIVVQRVFISPLEIGTLYNWHCSTYINIFLLQPGPASWASPESQFVCDISSALLTLTVSLHLIKMKVFKLVPYFLFHYFHQSAQSALTAQSPSI